MRLLVDSFDWTMSSHLNLMNNVVTGCSESTCLHLVVTCGNVDLSGRTGSKPWWLHTCARVCVRVRESPNLRERGPLGSLRTHVVLGQLRLLQSYWDGGWRGRSSGCCQLWPWPRLQPGSMGSYCREGGQMTQLWMGQGHQNPPWTSTGTLLQLNVALQSKSERHRQGYHCG